MLKKKACAIIVVALLLSVFMLGCQKKEAPVSPDAVNTENQASGLENYPSNTVDVVVPYSAGGGSDTGVRLVMKYAQEYIDQPIVIINKPGGSGAIGLLDILKEDADGHNMCYFTTGQAMLTLEENPKYKMDDFEFISRQVSDPRVIVFNKNDSRFSTREEFLKYVKDHPGQVKLGVGGLNSSPHYAALLFNAKGGFETAIVNFADGIAPAKSALLGNHIDAISISLGEAIPMMAEDQVIVVGVATDERLEDYNDIPTFKEQGIDFSFATQRGFVFKKGTDPKIVAFWDDIFEKVSQNPDYIEQAKNVGLQASYLSTEDYRKNLAQEEVTNKEIIDLLK